MNPRVWIPVGIIMVLLIIVFMQNQYEYVNFHLNIPDFHGGYYEQFEQRVDFWVLVLLCLSLGFIFASIADLIGNWKTRQETKRIINQENERLDKIDELESEVRKLNDQIRDLNRENGRLKTELDEKIQRIAALESGIPAVPTTATTAQAPGNPDPENV
jgi:uncharacterized membrane protein